MAAWVRAALLAAAVAASAVAVPAEALSLDVHHRYSATVREWAGHRAPPAGTAEYYAALARHDLRRRSLAAGPAPAAGGGGGEVAFADGNDTYRLNELGFLHYAVVALGTPNVTFLVALDTGSDLFWVPCDCINCAPLVSPNYRDLKFDTYSPQKSSTSRKVPCSSNLCDLQSACRSASSSCPYSIEYLSDNTSSTGVLVEDVLYLITEYGQPKIVTAPITFGCGRIQTGSFLGSAAPNGLLGLGMDSISVPSLLASEGVAANSFSMCFGEDGHGRINFGDTGSSDQQETPLNIYKQNPYYNISITGAMVGSKSFNTKFNAIVDSGTSFTALSDPMYTEITSSVSIISLFACWFQPGCFPLTTNQHQPGLSAQKPTSEQAVCLINNASFGRGKLAFRGICHHASTVRYTWGCVCKRREMIHIGAYAPKGKINITCIFHCVLFLHMFILNQFNSQVQDKPTQLDSSLPFEFCYSISPKGSVNPPNISLTAKGGSIFPVNDPIITITDNASNPMAYCLAVMKSEGVNLIGENFMSGLKVVFDRERKVLGWKNFNCYSVDNSSNLPVNPNPSGVPLKPALGPNSYTPEATKGASPNGTQVLQPSASFSLKLHCNRNVFVAAALLFLVIL